MRRFDGVPIEPRLLAEMSRCLHHRGPDACGTWSVGSVGLAHTRLSIIDLAGSAQPMAGSDGRTHLVFNGEILNYRQLRASLRYPFRTRGDTEVLLALHDRYGAGGVTQLRGQFAYALHDSRTDETHVVRDRLGILPLYYYLDDRVFAFASEIKALFPVTGVPRVDEASMHDYLAHRTVPSPHTFIERVRKVPAGHRLVVRADGTVRVSRYWDVENHAPRRIVAPDEAVRLLDNTLTDAVHDALVAHVPVGCYLSGGVDSSLIAAMAAREHSGGRMHTFAAGFADNPRDETPWSRRVARAIGSEHHEVMVTPDDFLDTWSRLSWHRDGPLSEPADVAVFRLAALARREVKVVLSGEGSDELFGGYPKYRHARATKWAGVLPGALLRRIERSLPPGGARLGVAVRALSEPTYAERMRGWFAPFTSSERERLLGRPAARSAPAPYRDGRGDPLRRMLYADIHTYLADNLLERGDRMSMAASLELRPPFLDHRVVELAFGLPSDVKVRGTTMKWVVKEVARRYVDPEVVDRRKVGFTVPMDVWFRGGLADMAFDLLTDSSSFVGTHFDRTGIRRLLTDHASGARNEQVRIWTLLSLEVWHRELVSRSIGHRI
ncbi:Asparagine synthetase [Rhodococcus sp. RD6.2]|nr:Asparagine synthetase [Rhodococcus sp. RD6.2]